jgi:hypothetical protein
VCRQPNLMRSSQLLRNWLSYRSPIKVRNPWPCCWRRQNVSKPSKTTYLILHSITYKKICHWTLDQRQGLYMLSTCTSVPADSQLLALAIECGRLQRCGASRTDRHHVSKSAAWQCFPSTSLPAFTNLFLSESSLHRTVTKTTVTNQAKLLYTEPNL